MSVVIPSLRAAVAVPGWAKNELWRRARAVPSLDLRFADNKSLVDAVTGASLVTFTRASSGTFVDSAGVIQTAATNAPRFDHNPTTGESLGLLAEEARTNLLLRSEEFGTSWTSTNITISSDAIVAPNGTLTADKAIATTTNSAHQLFQGTSGTSGITYTISFYVKAGEYNRFTFGPGNTAVGGDKTATINLSLSNPVVSQDVIFNSSAFATHVGNGWYRVGATFTATATGTMTVAVLQTIINNAGSSSFAGDGTSGIYVWGAQLEAGAFFTSYIATTTAAATRAADVASITGSAFSSWYRQDEGTVFASAGVQDFIQTNFPRLFSIDRGDATSNFIAAVRSSSSRRLDYSVFADSAGQATGLNNGIASAANSIVNGAWVYKANDFIGATGGVLTNSDTSGSVPTLLTTLGIGAMQGNATLYYNGTIRRLTYWPQRLPNSTLQSLTQ